MRNEKIKERTLVVVKPDGVQRSLIGEVIKRFERVGLKMVGLKMCVVDADHVEKHYLVDPNWKEGTGKNTIESYKKKGEKPPMDDPIAVGDFVLDMLKKYMVCGPVVAMVWEGAHAVELVRKLTGSTEPRTSDVGTLRGDFVLDSYAISDLDKRAVRNLIHASGSVEDAGKEIALWFKDSELMNYRLVQEEILYDVNLDGILE